MEDEDKTKDQLINELCELREKYAESEEAHTEYMERNEDLSRINTRFQHLINNNPAIIYAAKATGNFGAIFISSNAERLLGYRPNEFIEKEDFWFDHIHPADKERISNDISKLFEKGYHSYEYRFLNNEGEYRWMHDDMKLVRDSEGAPIEITGCWTDITENKKMGDRIKESKIFLENTFKTSMDAIIVTDLQGTITMLNDAMVSISGYSKDELTGKYIAMLSPPDETIRSDTEEAMEEFIKSGRTHGRESVWQLKNGKLIYIESNKSLINDKDGKTIGAMAIIRDVTRRKKLETALNKSHQELEKQVEERTANLKVANDQLKQEINVRKQAEEELRETRDYLENVIESSPDSIIVSDASGHITRANKSFCKLLGYSKEELLEKNIMELAPVKAGSYESTTGKWVEINDLFHDATKATMDRLGEGIKLSNWGSYLIRKDNMLVPTESTVVALYNAEGREQTGFVGIIRNITERKKAEEELRESEKKYHKLMETANDAIFIAETETGTIIDANKKAEELLGAPIEEIIGMHQDQLHTKEDRNYYRNVFTDQAQLERGFTTESLYVCHKNGQKVPIEISTSVTEIAGKKVMQSIFRDLTERRKAQDKIFEYQNKLKSLTSQLTLVEEKERRHFADYLHDQIGQKLFISKLKLEVLKKSLSSTDNTRLLNEIHKIILQMIKDTRSLTFELSPPILYQLGLEAALEWLTEQTAKQYGIMITFKRDGEEKALADNTKVLLFQVVRELISNVAKHAQTRNAKVSIQRDKVNIRICVEDDGVGFTPLNTASPSSGTGGFGLFSIGERVDHLGGQFKIESRPGHGTKATILAPLNDQHKAEGME